MRTLFLSNLANGFLDRTSPMKRSPLVFEQ